MNTSENLTKKPEKHGMPFLFFQTHAACKTGLSRENSPEEPDVFSFCTPFEAELQDRALICTKAALQIFSEAFAGTRCLNIWDLCV